jgi:hypothetical protein
MKYIKFFVFFSFIIMGIIKLNAQEITATVQCDVKQVFDLNKDNIIGFDKKIEDYINNHQWIGKNYNDDKINVNINILFTTNSQVNNYSAKVVFTSQRPIYDGEKKSGKTSNMLRILDDKWEFVFLKSQILTHEERRFDPLTSFIDYYMYIILGYDSDTYDKELNGTRIFEKAQTICQLASGTSNTGWKKATGSGYSRSDLADELLNPKFTPVRKAFFNYYYNGLDLKTQNEKIAYENVIKALEDIGQTKKSINTNSIIIRFFFDLKHLEIGDFFKDYEDQSIYNKLAKIDNSHSKTYLDALKPR